MSTELIEEFRKLRMELKEDMADNRSKTISEIKEFICTIDNKIKIVESKVNYLDREVRKRNIMIFGIEEEFESYWALEKFACDFFCEKLDLNIALTDLDFVKRLGKKSADKRRPVLVGFVSFRCKLAVIQNAHKLKGSNFSIAQDYSREVIETRRKLQPQLIQARQDGKFAVLRHDKLIIKEVAQIRDYNKKRLLSTSPPNLRESSSRPENVLPKKNKSDRNLKVQTNLEQFSFRSQTPSNTPTSLEKGPPFSDS